MWLMLSFVEITDIHVGWKDACPLEETGKFQTWTSKRYTSECGDRPGTERRGERMCPALDTYIIYGTYMCNCRRVLPPGKATYFFDKSSFVCFCTTGQSTAQNQCSTCNGCTNTEWHWCKRPALQPKVAFSFISLRLKDTQHYLAIKKMNIKLFLQDSNGWEICESCGQTQQTRYEPYQVLFFLLSHYLKF